MNTLKNLLFSVMALSVFTPNSLTSMHRVRHKPPFASPVHSPERSLFRRTFSAGTFSSSFLMQFKQALKTQGLKPKKIFDYELDRDKTETQILCDAIANIFGSVVTNSAMVESRIVSELVAEWNLFLAEIGTEASASSLLAANLSGADLAVDLVRLSTYFLQTLLPILEMRSTGLNKFNQFLMSLSIKLGLLAEGVDLSKSFRILNVFVATYNEYFKSVSKEAWEVSPARSTDSGHSGDSLSLEFNFDLLSFVPVPDVEIRPAAPVGLPADSRAGVPRVQRGPYDPSVIVPPVHDPKQKGANKRRKPLDGSSEDEFCGFNTDSPLPEALTDSRRQKKIMMRPSEALNDLPPLDLDDMSRVPAASSSALQPPSLLDRELLLLGASAKRMPDLSRDAEDELAAFFAQIAEGVEFDSRDCSSDFSFN
jgi:hypothetical protein